jgi:hypothetical protein
VIGEEEERVDQSGEEHAAGTEDAEALRPHGAHAGGEDIRHGLKDEIEAALAASCGPRHVAAQRTKGQVRMALR